MLDLSQLGKRLAIIDEKRCIGCVLCIKACPVDAILGAAKQMHTVIAEECTGCELCLPPCPVDCIEMVPADIPDHRQRRAQIAKQRYLAHHQRLAREKTEHASRLRYKKIARKKTNAGEQDPRKAAIAAAIARVKRKKSEKDLKG